MRDIHVGQTTFITNKFNYFHWQFGQHARIFFSLRIDLSDSEGTQGRIDCDSQSLDGAGISEARRCRHRVMCRINNSCLD